MPEPYSLPFNWTPGDPILRCDMNEWDDFDRAAIRRLAARERAKGVCNSTASTRAYRQHYAATGRVPSHGLGGYNSGCRCRLCAVAKSEQNYLHHNPEMRAVMA